MVSPTGVDAIFRIAFSIESSEIRDEYLSQACANNQVLHDRVVALLRAHREEPDFLASPATGVAATMDFVPVAERPGAQIGPYQLIQEIGEGGMGIVFMALQKEPVRRKVALKIIKPGMDTREVIARFEAEQQALAMMDHANIAKVHDAGTTDSGRPYFVMELVNGVPLTEYCDDNNLPTRERLELFMLLCHAVQHAHQKGIIHRDLKPSNILVTLHDGVPVPKIIDFGIAKAVNQQLTTKTLATGLGHMIGTPLYMSPEQAESSGLDIDTRSDIYSLGVLLYELLTGSTPFDQDQLKDVGVDEIRRVIREQEPQRPSTRISAMGRAATTMSERRKTTPVDLSHTLRQEVDWIVMKALEKDRTRRYDTASDFARDIQRYLNDEAVRACPPSKLYRLRKFTRRNRVGVWTTAAVALALIVGASVAAGQAYRATQAERFAIEQLSKAQEQQRLANEAAARERTQRTAAEAARKQAEMVTFFLVDAFRSPDPNVDGRSVTVAELLDQASRQLTSTLRAEPEIHATLLLALGKTYGGLGLAKDAIPLLERCRDIRSEELGQEHPDTLASITALVDALWMAERNEEAAKLAEDSKHLYLKVLGPDHLYALQLASSEICALTKTGNVAKAVSFGEHNLQTARGSLGREDATTIDIMHNLGMAHSTAGQHARAISLLEQAEKLNRKTHGPKHPQTLVNMKELSAAYARAGRFEDALSLQDKTFTLCREVFGMEHPLTMKSMADRGFILYMAGHYAEGAAAYDECRQIVNRIEGPASPPSVHIMLNLAVNHSEAGHFDEAVQLTQKALRDYVPAFGAEHRTTRFAWQTFARILVKTGQCDDAVELLERIVSDLTDSYGPQHEETLWMTMQLARAYAGLGRTDEAVALGEKTLREAGAAWGDEHRTTYRMKCCMGGLYSSAGQHDTAIAILTKMLPRMQDAFGPEHFYTFDAMVFLAVAYKAVGQLEDATSLLERALPLHEKILGREHPNTLSTMIALASCYSEQGQLADAEPILLAAYEACAQRFDSFPTRIDGIQAERACNQLIQLYEALNQVDEVDEWTKKLADLTDRRHTIPAQPHDVDEIIAAYGARQGPDSRKNKNGQ